MVYKWRENLTLKDKFKKRRNAQYSCIHDDFGSNIPCQHPAHYQGVTAYFSNKELDNLCLAVGFWLEDLEFGDDEMEVLKEKLIQLQDSIEYPYEEGF